MYSSDSEDSNQEKYENAVVTADERSAIREEISNLSFEELIRMKEDMGSKLYNKTFHGEIRRKCSFQRANKNRPREMSSKIRPKLLRGAPIVANSPQAKKVVSRDPRFDPLCGQFEEKEFKSNYKFLHDIRLKERDTLRLELKNCNNPERAKTIRMLVQRTTNQIKEQEKQEKEQNNNSAEKKNLREKLKNGEQPKYKKKSIKKLENLVDQYESLKKTNKLQKHIERRSKKLTSKNKQERNDQMDW